MTELEALRRGTSYRVSSWKAFLFVLRFLRLQLRRMILVCLIDVSIVLINLTIPWFGKTVIDQAFPQRNWTQVWTIAASVSALAGLVFVLTGLRNFLYNSTEQLLQVGIRQKIYGHLQKLSLDTLETLTVGQQQFRITTDSDRIAHMLVRILPTLTMLVEFALILVAAIYVDPLLTLIALGFLVPWTILFVWVTHYGRVFDRRRLRLVEQRDAGILQAAASFPIIKSLGRTRTEVRRNALVSVAVQRVANQGYLILVFFEFATQKLLPYVKTATIYLLLARKVVLGEMTLGMTVPMIAYLGRLTFPIERIVNFGCWIWQTMVSAERMMQILTTEPAVQDLPDAKRIDAFDGRLDYRSVSYDRIGVGRVLEDITLEVRPGRKVAVVGLSGCGKSTLLGLALRYYDPSSGVVEVDGHDLRSLDRTSYLRRCATVTQDTFVFGGSLADNLLVANPDSGEDELRRVLEAVELDDWLESLPNGLDTDLESGLGLSAGQRQRLGVARALLTDAPLLLLDSPTSALDGTTEKELTATLNRVMDGKAALIATHRLGTVEDADEIIVLDKGRIVQRGSHGELMEQEGMYKELQRLYHATAVKTEDLVEAPV